MSYATTDDLAARLGPANYLQLTDDEGAGTPNAERAVEALAAATAEIDSRLVAHCAVPVDVSTEPDAAGLLRALTLDLAEHRLHARRPPVPEDVRQKAAAARQWLHDFLVGRAHLPLSQAAQETVSTGVVAEASGPRRVFRRSESSGGSLRRGRRL